MKAQVAVEFITSYAWALLVIVILAIVVYYFLSLRPENPICNFSSDLPCNSYQFYKRSTGTMTLRVVLTNNLLKVIGFQEPGYTLFEPPLIDQTIEVQNIGRSGANTYVGKCMGPDATVENGDGILCVFNITENEMVPALGSMAKFSLTMNYILCETDPKYPSACNGTERRTIHGSIIAPFETGINESVFKFLDVECEDDEDYITSPFDCPHPRPARIVVDSDGECEVFARLKKIGDGPENETTAHVNATVYDQDNHPLPNTPVHFYIIDYEAAPNFVRHIRYTFSPQFALTNSSGVASTEFFWYGCDCCFPHLGLVLFQYAASAGYVSSFDPRCETIPPDAHCV